LLAYTFWHRRNNEVSENSYEEKLIGYHASLEQSGLQGFLGSTVCKLSKVPWLPSDAEVYEDWYVLEGSEVIDKLNEVAVSGARKPGHDDIAKIAGDFRGGLYQLKIGPASNIRGKIAIWLSKPRGTTYESFYDTISEKLDAAKGSLWRRQMVLGPTSEFCITTSESLAVPEAFKPLVILREIVWQSPRLAHTS
jgi:hypothetical protein